MLCVQLNYEILLIPDFTRNLGKFGKAVVMATERIDCDFTPSQYFRKIFNGCISKLKLVSHLFECSAPTGSFKIFEFWLKR